jgi:CubicO group peptidase (beta-lactamase class C family)
MSRAAVGFGAILLLVQQTAWAGPELKNRENLARSIDAAVSQKGLPSVVVVVFDDHRILWSQVAGYSDLARKTAPTLSTRYRLGSIAKAVTSTVLAIAVQRGSISFDKKVRVPASQGYRWASLGELVNMQAGLAQAVCYDGITGDADRDCGGGFNARFGVAITDGKGRYSYSNMGPQLAADALARQMHDRFDRIASNLLFLPAGMTGATFSHTRSGALAADYQGDGKRFEHDFRILPEAGAGLEASAEDLVRFGQLHITGRAADGRRLLSATTLESLHSAPNGDFYGFGWGRIGQGRSTEVLISDGQVNGGQAMLLINPLRKVGAVVISNAAHDEVSDLALAAMDTVVPGTSVSFGAAVGQAQEAHQAKVSGFLPPKNFEGTGTLLGYGTQLVVEVKSSGAQLRAVIAGTVSDQSKSEEDEGFRGWAVPCPQELPACRRPGATAKLWLSRDASGLGGQLQVTSFNGQVPFPVSIELH